MRRWWFVGALCVFACAPVNPTRAHLVVTNTRGDTLLNQHGRYCGIAEHGRAAYIDDAIMTVPADGTAVCTQR